MKSEPAIHFQNQVLTFRLLTKMIDILKWEFTLVLYLVILQYKSKIFISISRADTGGVDRVASHPGALGRGVE